MAVLTNEEKKEYANLMHEYANLMNEIEAYKIQKQAGNSSSVSTASDSQSDPVISNSNAASQSNAQTQTDNESNTLSNVKQSDEDRLAELRAKLNLQ